MRVVKNYREKKVDATLEIRGNEVFELTHEHGTGRPTGGSRHRDMGAIELLHMIERLADTDTVVANLPKEWVRDGVVSVDIAP